jgi:hypothetical protein
MSRTTIACLLVLSLAACGKTPAERATDAMLSAATGQKVSVDKDGDRTTVHTDQGDMTVDNTRLPAEFPKDVYLPASYKIETAMTLPNAMVVHLLAPGQVEPIAAAAGRQMLAQGWTSMMTMAQSEKGSVVMYEKQAEKRHATLTIAEDGDGNGVQVGYQLATERQ